VIRLPPKTLLNHADVLLTDPPNALLGRWPAATAVLLRQALERSLAQLWLDRVPALLEAPYRVQLLCLPRYINADIAVLAAYTWSELSSACHQRAYDLPPTSVELARWYERVEALVREVARISAARASKKEAQGR
jgi:hypothetical protein